MQKSLNIHKHKKMKAYKKKRAFVVVNPNKKKGK